MIVAGADGCRAGWAVVLFDPATGVVSARIVPTVADLLAHTAGARVVAVDMPIGLLDAAVAGGRECDREARRRLGWPGSSSVFSPPARAAFGHATYRAALAAQRASSPTRTGFSLQAWHLLPKIQDLDRALTPALQERVVEVHPELSFRTLNGGAGCGPKKSAAGRARRAALLRAAGLGGVDRLVGRWFGQLPGQPPGTSPRRDAAIDDLLDACAAAWTAARILAGTAERLPAEPPCDSRGLRMEIRF
jgi:predicted RNase H-like nuclease